MQFDQDEVEPVIKRLRRAQGQLAAVIRMLEEGRECKDVLTQLSACSKALDRAGFALISAGMQNCLREDNPNREESIEAMEKLFLSLA